MWERTALRRPRTGHLKLLEQIRDATGEEIPLAWGPDQVRGVTVIEVYPALALLALAPEGEERLEFGAGYKKKPERDRKTRKVRRDPGLGGARGDLGSVAVPPRWWTS